VIELVREIKLIGVNLAVLLHPSTYIFSLYDAIIQLAIFSDKKVFNEVVSNNAFKNDQSLLSTNNSNFYSSLTITDKINMANEEISSNFRYQKFSNPVFKYDYKAGNYFPTIEIDLYPGLMTTASEITGGLRMSS